MASLLDIWGKQILRKGVLGCFYADEDLTASASWNQKCTLFAGSTVHVCGPLHARSV